MWNGGVMSRGKVSVWLSALTVYDVGYVCASVRTARGILLETRRVRFGVGPFVDALRIFVFPFHQPPTFYYTHLFAKVPPQENNPTHQRVHMI